jgi:hypothetical protein
MAQGGFGMPIRSSVFSVVALLAGSLLLGLAVAAPMPSPQFAAQSNGATEVDVELVLAVDISFSMDPDEQELQREGYMHALTSTEFLRALRDGIHGKIALTYFEWANINDRRIIVPWRLIDGPEAADAFVAEIARAPYRRASRTSVSGALEFGAQLFENSGFKGLRKVIDVSGDGVNNNGPPVTIMRDEVLSKGIVINGLPIMIKQQFNSGMDIEMLDVYFEDCVVGGPGSFVIPIKERDKFKEATRTKLVQEIAAVPPMPQVVPVSSKAPRVPCMIGEQLWQQRWGN